MAAKRIPLHKVPHIATALASAALEWLLIFLLFVHAIFSYLITKFARYCKLPVPCLLCSRLDHILGCEKLGFYWDLICQHHKLEISSLVVCHVHNKLVEVHNMCENCLFSFATINKSNAETYRLLVGKLGKDPPGDIDEDPFEDHKHGDFSKRICSCCNEPYILRNHAQNFLQSHLDFDDLKNGNEPTQERKDYDPLPHVEYSKVKNFSDTESEVPFSDDDDGIALICESRKRDFVIQGAPMVPHVVTLPDDLISEKLIHTDSTSELSLLDLHGKIGNNDHERRKNVSSTMAIGHGLEEISWLHVEPKVDASVTARNSELLDEVPQASNVIVTRVEEPKVCVDGTETVELKQISSEKATHEEIKPVIELETSSEIPRVEKDKVTKPVQLEQQSSNKVTVEETKPVIERKTSPEIPYVENDNVTKFIQLEERSSDKVTVEEMKPVTKHETSPEIPAVVNNKIKETEKLEQISIEKVTHEENKPVVEREASPEILSVENDRIKETIELEQIISEKVTSEEIKPIVECEASVEILSVVNDKVTEAVELEQGSCQKLIHEETKPLIERGPSSESPPFLNDSVTLLPDNLELGEAYKLAVGNNRRQLSGKLLEQISAKESSRISEDLKLLLSQISAARGIDLPFNEISPRISGNADDLKSDLSGVIGMQMLQRRISLERNESGISLDGSVIGEMEGENEIERLKRQVEHDKKLMGALYKELEEERNASTIAANQAMAMITRLQEEKASLQMEALQCVRMMEEQAEYDVDALQKANDLLAEKEKEIQDLEADLEFFRSKLEDASMLEREMESSCGLEMGELAAEQSGSNHYKNSENVESNSTVDKPHAFSKDDLSYNSYSEFEDERLFILECLRKLEKKFHLFSYDGTNLDAADNVKSQTREEKESDLNEPNCKERFQEISSREEENDCGGQCYSRVSRMTDAIAIGDAVSNLIRRLEALEAGHNGIDHSLKSVKRGDEDIEQHSGDSLSPQGSMKE